MLNPQRSPNRSTTVRRPRSTWQEPSGYTPDLLGYLRQIPPAYLGGAGLLLILVGMLSASGGLVVGLGVVLLIAAGIMAATRPRTRVMYWRGRRIELPIESSARSPLRRWLGRR